MDRWHEHQTPTLHHWPPVRASGFQLRWRRFLKSSRPTNQYDRVRPNPKQITLGFLASTDLSARAGPGSANNRRLETHASPSPDGSQVTWSSNRGSRAVWSQILSRAYHGRSEHAWARQQWGVCMFNVRLGIKEATLLGGLASHLGGLHNLRSLLLAAFLLCPNSSNVPV